MSSYPQEWKERLIGIVLAEEGKQDNAKFELANDTGKSKKQIERWLAELTREVFREWLRMKEAEPSPAGSPATPTSTGGGTFARYVANFRIEQLREELGRTMSAGDCVSAKEKFDELCILDPMFEIRTRLASSFPPHVLPVKK